MEANNFADPQFLSQAKMIADHLTKLMEQTPKMLEDLMKNMTPEQREQAKAAMKDSDFNNHLGRVQAEHNAFNDFLKNVGK
jgi:hypothetical protein